MADVMSEALSLLIFTKKMALNEQTTKMEGKPEAKNVQNIGRRGG